MGNIKFNIQYIRFNPGLVVEPRDYII